MRVDVKNPVALLLSALFAAAVTGAAVAQETETINVIGHPVHQRVSTEGPAGDVAAQWSEETGTAIQWTTLDIGPLNERLLRELTLPQTSFDVAFLLNTHAVPSVVEQLEPLDAHMAEESIEDFDDFFAGMVDAMTFDDQLYGVPFRAAASGMIYNQALFEERGIDGPPETVDEFIDAVEKLTYTSDDGTKVYGFAIPGNHYANIVDVARMWNGDFITPDYEVAAGEEGMITAVQLLRDLFEQGQLPSNWTNLSSEDVDNLMQSGRAAITFGSLGDAQSYNTAEGTAYPGSFQAAPLPVAEDVDLEVGPSKVEFWTMVIPANSTDKEAAWEFIRYMSSPESTLATALNGNGPTRGSTYTAPDFQENVGYAEVAQQILEVARIPLPAFDKANRAADVFLEGVHLAVLGQQEPRAAMEDVASRVEPLLP